MKMKLMNLWANQRSKILPVVTRSEYQQLHSAKKITKKPGELILTLRYLGFLTSTLCDCSENRTREGCLSYSCQLRLCSVIYVTFFAARPIMFTANKGVQSVFNSFVYHLGDNRKKKALKL